MADYDPNGTNYGVDQGLYQGDEYQPRWLESAQKAAQVGQAAELAGGAGAAGAGAAGAAGLGAMGAAMPVLAGAALGAQAVDTALLHIPTQAEKYAKDEMARFESEGAQGLTGQDRLLAESLMMDPMRAQAGENRMRDEAMMASMGGASAGDLQRAREAERQQISQGMQNAGVKIFAADLDAKRQDLQRYKENLAYRDALQKQRRAAVSGLLGGGAQLGGKVAAASAATTPADERTTSQQLALDLFGTKYDDDSEMILNILANKGSF